MQQYPPHAITPPETIELTFERVTQSRLWTNSVKRELAALSTSPFCTDQECSALSGVPERSLRLLQTTGVLHATKAPRTGGSFKRVWHLPEAAVAAAIESTKAATNLDYITVAGLLFEGAPLVRRLFVDYLEFSEQKLDEFVASFMLTPKRDIALAVTKPLMAADPLLRDASPKGDGFIPVSKVVDGRATKVDRREYERFQTDFAASPFYTVVSLTNLFKQFERDARKMRT